MFDACAMNTATNRKLPRSDFTRAGAAGATACIASEEPGVLHRPGLLPDMTATMPEQMAASVIAVNAALLDCRGHGAAGQVLTGSSALPALSGSSC